METDCSSKCELPANGTLQNNKSLWQKKNESTDQICGKATLTRNYIASTSVENEERGKKLT